ncbi:MAG TPA: hypothetical protein VKT21_06340 [Thermoplasmata archaeon]|nr:hypothetical protein [Thermoplasmata archaeon]
MPQSEVESARSTGEQPTGYLVGDWQRSRNIGVDVNRRSARRSPLRVCEHAGL